MELGIVFSTDISRSSKWWRQQRRPTIYWTQGTTIYIYYIVNLSFLFIFKKIYNRDTCNLCYFAIISSYETARAKVESIFGPRTHRDFPGQIRLSGQGCAGNGLYPSSLGKSGVNEYSHTGLDLSILNGEYVSCIYPNDARISLS